MERDIWKWIFQEMDEEDFYHLVQLTGVKVKGFRSVERKMVATLRSRIMAEWLRPKVLLRVRELVGHEMKREENYCEMDKQMLVSCMQEKDKAIHILSQLMQSKDKDKEALAAELFSYVKLEEKPMEEERGIDLQDIIRSLEEKVKKQEEKIIQTAKKMTHMEQELSKKEAEVKRYEGELQELKKQMFSIKKRNEAYEEECSINKTRMIDLQKEQRRNNEELDRQAKVLEEKQSEINRLHALCLTQTGVVPKVMEKRSIAVVCDAQMNGMKSGDQTVILLEHIDDAIEKNQFATFHYVCLLRFSMTPASIRRVKKVVSVERLKEFYTMHEFNEWEESL